MIRAEVNNPDKILKQKIEPLKTTKVKCNTCGIILGELIEIDVGLSMNKEIVNMYMCPCGGESFAVKSKQKTYFHSAPELVVTSITNISDNRYKSILERHDEPKVNNV